MSHSYACKVLIETVIALRKLITTYKKKKKIVSERLIFKARFSPVIFQQALFCLTLSASVKFNVYASFQLQDMSNHKIFIDDLISRIFKESSMVLVALESWKGTHLKYRLGGLIPVLITYNLWEGKIKSLHFFLSIYLFVCTGSQLQHMGSLVATYELLVVACEIQFLYLDQSQVACIGSMESQPLDHQKSSKNLHFL